MVKAATENIKMSHRTTNTENIKKDVTIEQLIEQI